MERPAYRHATPHFVVASHVQPPATHAFLENSARYPAIANSYIPLRMHVFPLPSSVHSNFSRLTYEQKIPRRDIPSEMFVVVFN